MHFISLHSECVPNAFGTVKPLISDNISLATVIPLMKAFKLCRQLCRQLKYSVNYRLMVLILGPNVSRLIPHVFRPHFAIVTSYSDSCRGNSDRTNCFGVTQRRNSPNSDKKHCVDIAPLLPANSLKWLEV